ERRVPESIEHRPESARLTGCTEGPPDLAENLVFAEDHRVEPGGNAQQVAHGGLVRARIADVADDVRLHAALRGQELAKQLGACALVSAHRVDLDAAARGEDERFFYTLCQLV